MVAEAVKAFEALAPVANPKKRLTRSATGSRKWWRSARSVDNLDNYLFISTIPFREWRNQSGVEIARASAGLGEQKRRRCGVNPFAY